MKYKKLIFLFSFFSNLILSESLEVSVGAKETAKVKLTLCLIDTDAKLQYISDIIKKDFEFGGQFEVSIKECEGLKKKKDVTSLLETGAPLAIYLSKTSDNEIEWRLYDTTQGEMIKGKKVKISNDNDFELANTVSNQIWPEMTAQDSCFCTVIVACKQEKNKNNKQVYSHLYVIHPFTKKSMPLITGSVIAVSPKWNPKKPLLYYPQQTPYNIRLMMLDLNKNKHLITNFDGLNMTPAFSNEGKTVLSLTKNGIQRLCKYEFDEKTKKGKYISSTDTSIHAISPSFIDEDRIVFCAIDMIFKKPRIAILSLKNKDIQYITQNGSSVSPDYCRKNNKIAYCKSVNKVYQIFTYDLDSNEHKQITSDSGDKSACCWSPCGNYIAYSLDNNKSSIITVLNLLTNEKTQLTPSGENWNSPAWSYIYEELPFIR